LFSQFGIFTSVTFLLKMIEMSLSAVYRARSRPANCEWLEMDFDSPAAASTSPLTEGLTSSQRQAVDFFHGPLLILAGPGSGKTRVITRRIARLVERGVQPSRILAITFTNRAAREMQERVDSLLPGSSVWVSTFHRFCASVLRRRANLVGLESNYVIFDKADQVAVVRQVLSDLDLDVVRASPARISGRISQIKNSLTGPDEFVRSMDDHMGEPFDLVVAQVYPRYQKALLDSNAVDFDDLLLHVVRLFHENPELRSDYDRRFDFVLVDEYQDTNAAQYQLVKALSSDIQNVCVTGDPDQSIYAWRGASIGNILNFEHDYPNASMIRLEQNFRSTKSILRSADRLIAHNRMRKNKSLVTDNDEGEPVRLLTFPDSRNEADGIARLCRKLVHEDGLRYSDIAIFYRVNSMSRELELAMTRNRVPLQIAAGLAFYDRAEIRDLLAYLRLIENPADQVAFNRVCNKPARGLGKTTQTKLLRWAERNGMGPMEAARCADQIDDITKTAKVKLKVFSRLMESFSLAHAGSVSALLKKVVVKTGYARSWGSAPTEQAIEKKANVEELINAAAQYDEAHADDPTVSGFLETTSLRNDDDLIEATSGKVTLMTMHAAKGLEFPVVFVVGIEHGLIPHERSIKSDDPKQIEEERRLLFVGMTRAMKQLFLTTAQMRAERGTPRITIPSTFLGETEFVQGDVDADGLAVEEKSVSGFTKKEQGIRERLKLAFEKNNGPVLTTGAALLAGNTDAGLPQTFAMGMRVRHPQYGTGTVTDVTGFLKKQTVTVKFHDDQRSETFRVAHCPLQPVGGR